MTFSARAVARRPASPAGFATIVVITLLTLPEALDALLATYT